MCYIHIVTGLVPRPCPPLRVLNITIVEYSPPKNHEGSYMSYSGSSIPRKHIDTTLGSSGPSRLTGEGILQSVMQISTQGQGDQKLTKRLARLQATLEGHV